MIAALLGCAALAAAAGDAPKGASESIVLQGAEVDAGDGNVFKPGTVVITDGRISAVGPTASAPSGARIVDCQKLVLTAGLVDAASQLGTFRFEGFSEQASEVIRQQQTSEPGNYIGYYDDVYKFLTGKAPNPVPPGDGIKTIRIIDAALESSAQGKVISL
jgi:predicted dehydrogenase